MVVNQMISRLFLLSMIFVLIFALLSHTTPPINDPIQQNTKSKWQAEIVSKDLENSVRLLATDYQNKLAQAWIIHQNNQQNWKKWLENNNEFIYVSAPPFIEISTLTPFEMRQVREKIKSLQTKSTSHFSIRYTTRGETKSTFLLQAKVNSQYIYALIVKPSLQTLQNHSEQNMRANGKGIPKGPHIRSMPANKKNISTQKSHYLQRQVVVKFKKQLTETDFQRISRETQAQVKNQWGTIFVIESKTQSTHQLLQYFRKWDIDYAEAHYLYSTNKKTNYTVIPNDHLYSPYQWNLRQIQADRGWKRNKGNGQVTIAVIDTGIDANHPELKSKIKRGYNAITPGAAPTDGLGHGTHVAGIIGAAVNNYQGIAGLSWFNPILPVKVLDETGSGHSFAVAQGIVWATDQGAKVINLSLGNYAQGKFLHDAVKYAYAKDVVLIAASGNENTDQLSYPAAYPEVVAVAATDEKKQRAPFSNYGNYLDLAAPGMHIASTFIEDSYAALSGTSMAAPHVSALAALIRSNYPNLSNREVINILKSSATDLGVAGYDSLYGHGLINVEKALQIAKKPLLKSNSEADIIHHPLQIWLLKMIQNLKNPRQ